MAGLCANCVFLESYRDCNGKVRHFCGLLDIWSLETEIRESCEFFEPVVEVLQTAQTTEGGRP